MSYPNLFAHVAVTPGYPEQPGQNNVLDVILHIGVRKGEMLLGNEPLEAILISIICMLYGTVSALYADRIGKYITRKTLFYLKGISQKDVADKYFDDWPYKAYWFIWLWVIRIIGIIMAGGGLLAAISILVQRFGG